MRGCLLGLWIIIILLTSGLLCFVRVSVVTRSRGILFMLGIILIVIATLTPNIFSITFVILPVPGFDCFSRRRAYKLVRTESTDTFLYNALVHVFVTVHSKYPSSPPSHFICNSKELGRYDDGQARWEPRLKYQ